MSTHDILRVKRTDLAANQDETKRLNDERTALAGGPDYRDCKNALDKRILLLEQTTTRLQGEILLLTKSLQPKLF